MGSAADLITAAKNQKGIGSDAMLAKKLGVQRSLISGWRSGAVPMPDERILELADMANVDPVHWVIAIKAEQGGPRMGPLWRTALQRICAAALILRVNFNYVKSDRTQTAQLRGLRFVARRHELHLTHQRMCPDALSRSNAPTMTGHVAPCRNQRRAASTIVTAPVRIARRNAQCSTCRCSSSIARS